MLRWTRKTQLGSWSTGLDFSFTSDLLWDVDVWVLVSPSGNREVDSSLTPGALGKNKKASCLGWDPVLVPSLL